MCVCVCVCVCTYHPCTCIPIIHSSTCTGHIAIVAASILEEIQMSYSFMSKPFWKEQLLKFSPDVSSLTTPTLDIDQRRIYISQLVDSMFAMENVNDGVIDFLIHVVLDEDMRRSAMGLVSKLHCEWNSDLMAYVHS